MLNYPKLKFKILTVGLLLGVMGCQQNTMYSQFHALPNYWDKDTVCTFNIEVTDEKSPLNMYIHIRNNYEYAFNNLYLISKMQYPSGYTDIDTLQYQMAYPDGKLMGKGFSDLKENKLWFKGFKSPFYFKEKGLVQVHLSQAMRQLGKVEGVERLKGVTDVGLSVEK